MKKVKVRVLSLLMTLVLMLSVFAPAVSAAVDEHSNGSKGTLNYVSIGDSMTNGYGFDGYNQTSDDRNVYDIMTGEGMYGEGSYPLQFEQYLKDKGYDVNHTKLAPSGLLADNLLYLLGGVEQEFDDDWGGYLSYIGTYTPEQLKPHFQKAVIEADIITLCIGNASFGAYLVQQVSDIIGVMGATPDINEDLTLENGLALLEDEEMKQVVIDVYNEMKESLAPYVENAPNGMDVDAILDVVAYTTATFVMNYEAVLDRIIELNPDVEIILIGIMNTTYGMEITGDGFSIPVGDIMDNFFATLNAYIAGLPAAKQYADEYQGENAHYYNVETGETKKKLTIEERVSDAFKSLIGEETTWQKIAYSDAPVFYYAEQPTPEFIVQAFDDLAAEGWNNIDCGDSDCVACTDKDPSTVCADGRLSGKTVRERQLEAYNDGLRYAISSAFGMNLPAITFDEVSYYEKNIPNDTYDSYLTSVLFADEMSQFSSNGYNPEGLKLIQKFLGAIDNDYSKLNETYINANFSTIFAAEIEKEISMAIYLAIEEAVVANVDTMEIAVDGLLGIAGDMFAVLGEFPEALTHNPGPMTIKTELVKYFTRYESGRSMCKVYALFKVGNGMSVHPTPAAHDNLFKAIVLAYENEYTAQDETIKNLLIIRDLIIEYYDEAYAYGYDKAEEEGLIALLNEYLDDAQDAVDVADAWILANSEYIRSEEFALELKNASADARATIEAARALINNADEIDAESFDYLMKLLAALETNVEDLGALLGIAVMDAGHYLDPKIAALNAQAEKQIAILKAQAEKQIAILKAELENAIDEAKAAILAEIARIEAELEAAIAQIKADVEAEIAKVVAAYEAAIAELEALKAKLIADIESAIEDAIDTIDAIIAYAKIYLKENLPEIYKQFAEFLSDKLYMVGDYLYNWMIEHPDVVVKLLVKYGDDIKAALIIHAGDIVEAYKPIIEAAFSGEYAMDEESFYLAIGDNSAFAGLLAGKLNLEDQYEINGWEDISFNTIQKADLITIANSENNYSGFAVEQALGYIAEYLDADLRTSLNEYIEKAFAEFFSKCTPTPSKDLQTKIIESFKAILNGTIDEVKVNYLGDASVVEMDWAAMVGEENVTYIDDARKAMKNLILDAGVPEVFATEVPVVELLFANTEMFEGEAAEFIKGFEQAEIYEMFGEYSFYTLEVPAADALTFAGESYVYGYMEFTKNYAQTVQMINAFNPEATVVLLGHYNAFAGVDFFGVDLGELYANVAKATSAQVLACAVLYENAVYVDIMEAETVLTEVTEGAIVPFEQFILAYFTDSSITEISEAGNEYVCDQILKALNITDSRCHHIANEDDGDCTTEVTCKLCGVVMVEANEAHRGGTATCTAKAKCEVCNKEYGDLAAHTPNEDDGDCTTAITCKVCGAETTAANAAHTGGTATCIAKAKCTVCNKEYGDLAAHTGGTATCSTKAKCTVCNKEYGDLAAHTPNADDGDCTTAITCKVCGAVTTAAATAHTYGDWVVVKEATATEAGERQRTCSVCGKVEKEVIAALGDPSTTGPSTTTPVTTTTPATDDEVKEGLGAGAIVGITVGSVVVLGTGGFALFWFVIKKKTWADFLLIFKR